MKKLLKLLQRLREPSTWAGVAVLATMAGANSSQVADAAAVVGTLAAIAAIFIPEGDA